MLSPKELKKTSFNKALKGYSVNEVDEYISYLLAKYTDVYNAYAVLEGKYEVALQQLENAKSAESTISATIVNAQKMADAVVNDAKEKAAEIRNSVSESCDRILDVYVSKVAAERDKLVKCEAAVAEFKNALYEAYKTHLEMIDNIMPDEEPTPYLTDDELVAKAVELAGGSVSPASADGVAPAVEKNEFADEKPADSSDKKA